jgi:hypothetical protein
VKQSTIITGLTKYYKDSWNNNMNLFPFWILVAYDRHESIYVLLLYNITKLKLIDDKKRESEITTERVIQIRHPWGEQRTWEDHEDLEYLEQ